MYSHDLGSVPASTTTWYRRARATARQATVAVSATYCAELGSLKIVVADRGRWRRPHPRSVSDARGRGRLLIDLSTSRALWILAEAGTTLAMHWNLSGPAPALPSPTLRDATGAP